MFPRGVPELGSQGVETTLAGMSQSKCYLASTGAAMKLKCLHWTFQFQQTDIPTSTNQHSNKTCPASSMLQVYMGKNCFFIFICFPICLMTCRTDTHSGWHLEDLLEEQLLQNKCTSNQSCWGTFATSTQSILNWSPQWQISTLGCSWYKSYPLTACRTWPTIMQKKFLCSDLGEQKHFSQRVKFSSTIKPGSIYTLLIAVPNMNIFKCPMLRPIFSILSVQISEIYLLWTHLHIHTRVAAPSTSKQVLLYSL